VPVAAWVAPADLPAGTPGDEAALAGVCDLASSVLYGLSGRRWAGHASRTIAVFGERTPWWWQRADLGLPWDATWGACSLPAVPLLVGGELFNHSGCDRPPAIRLPDYPVRQVTAVTVAGQVRDPDSYRLIGNRFLEDGWDGWPTCGLSWGEVMSVSYDYGAVPPAAGVAAARLLASELAKATAGQPSQLPGYIMSRVRQAVTETYVRTDLLFDKGRTGLAQVDLWLATVNPSGLRRRARAWSPDTDPHYRTTTAGGTP
jgi:hypothetical protein